MTRREKRNMRNGILFTLPWILGFACFTIYPVIMSFYYSFCDYSVFEPPVFVGLTNYAALMKDSVFWTSIGNTLYYAAFSIPLSIAVAVSLAILLNARVRGMEIFRTIFFLPVLVPMVAMSILWLLMFNPEFGIINWILKAAFGIVGPNWLGDENTALPALVLMSLWAVGQGVVTYLAGLQDVPKSLMEAAELDGANFLQKTMYVTIPMLSPVIYFNLIMGIIGALQIFAQPYIMTGGGPMRATCFYTLYLYQRAFEDYQMGYASAMAWILFLMILVFTLWADRVSKKHVYYRGGR